MEQGDLIKEQVVADRLRMADKGTKGDEGLEDRDERLVCGGSQRVWAEEDCQEVSELLEGSRDASVIKIEH